MKRILFTIGTIILALSLVSGCRVVDRSESLPPKHPEELETGQRPDCLECHEDVSTGALKPYDTFRHTDVFVKEHRHYARGTQALCVACHEASFCGDCHARREDLAPNVKYGDRPDRMLPHRGDYIILHRMEGRVNPARCYRCHGTGNNAKCAACHK